MPTFAMDLIDDIASTTVGFAGDFITNYWGYILAFSAIAFLAKKFMGLRKGGM